MFAERSTSDHCEIDAARFKLDFTKKIGTFAYKYQIEQLDIK